MSTGSCGQGDDGAGSGEAASVVALTIALVSALVTAGLSQRRALSLAGMSRSSWHYQAHPRARVTDPVPHTSRRAVSWLSEAERAAITTALRAAFGAGRSVYHAFYQALDADDPVASLSTWYRVARGLEAARPTRRRATRRSTAIPSLVATAPLQVWSWDITKLKGPYRGVTYELYMVVDVFSRMIVAWRLEEHEDDELARDMFQAAFTRFGARPTVVHSDGGPSMTSNTLTGLFRDLGIEVSRNRPRVSNDNPYSESLFKTAKYVPTYPAYFTSLEQATAWVEQFVPWSRALPLRPRGTHPSQRPRRHLGRRPRPPRPEHEPPPRRTPRTVPPRPEHQDPDGSSRHQPRNQQRPTPNRLTGSGRPPSRVPLGHKVAARWVR